jgi:acyl carrier protein
MGSIDRERVKLDLIKIIAEELEIDPDSIKEDTSLQDDLEADSLEAINIGLAIEESFNVKMDDDTIHNFRTIRDITDNLIRMLG